ncbi:ABC transporter permease [Paraburkholderia hospita]|jgi:simple sugar transport system permease protein|uniref:ABC transporter permease n=1 Tax=Paraburkholderia hospita TaxID=169430 RepID=A0AAN1JGN2_9BURK|nr:ABC transporter permease [Paraburkholderia hospita]SOE83343.1 nucleoside ABC transporter membrane protein [Burkholderia sp. YR290]AUT73587.1 ABC transporter permease [Paraburkholderia hospita]EIM99090.1 inner-membrane translocator [Paraburkholderia hospita]OUL72876.1 ABC transporter permease [Paraburkholderia hospita]OUL97285.1 ABC transporter permease [Paraburkholderia hospita]
MNPQMKVQTLFGSTLDAQGWRARLPHVRVACVIAGAVVFAMLAALALIALMGVPIGDALAAFADGAWGSPYAIGASINRSLAFALVGTGFVIANRAKLTNVGGEGQLAIGGIVATALSLYGGCAHLPFGLSFIVPMLGAAAAGALWGGVPGVLKAKAGTNEVISTLLLSFIAVWLLYWCVQSEALLRQPMTNGATLPESLEIPDLTKLPAIFAASGMNLNIGLPVTIALAIGSAFLLTRTRFGLSLRAAGLNAVAARRAGLPITSSIVGGLALAGAFSGLAGALMLQGDQYSLKAGFSSGYGFDGLVVGLLARGSITGVFAAALLFGFLRSGGINMEMVAQVPSALVLIVQGIVTIALAGGAMWLDKGDARQ